MKDEKLISNVFAKLNDEHMSIKTALMCYGSLCNSYETWKAIGDSAKKDLTERAVKIYERALRAFSNGASEAICDELVEGEMASINQEWETVFKAV